MLLIFLQCAWRPGAVFKNREDWLEALWESYSGKRLKEMIPAGIPFYVENSTTKVGDNPDAIFPPDPAHMSDVISKTEPTIILACGEVAQRGMEILSIPYIEAPHPAYRALSKKMTAEVRMKIERAATTVPQIQGENNVSR